jgi:3-methyladenine DNA glycosylase AlkC
MAEPLKNYYGPDVPARIARMIKEVDSGFDEDAFLADALDGYQALELTPRARQIAQALGRHLPQDYERAIEILIASLGPKLQAAELTGIDVFVYLPHVFFIAEFGVDHFEASMRAQ